MSAQLVLTSRVTLALVLLVSITSKTRRRAAFDGFLHWVRSLGLAPQWLSPATAVAIVVAETVALVLIVAPATALAGLALMGALTLAFAIAIAIVVRRGVVAPCRCFGISARPMGWLEVARNLALGLLAAGAAVAVLLAPPSGLSAPSPSAPGVVAALVAGSALAAVTVRLDSLPASLAARRRRNTGQGEAPDDEEEPTGLPGPGTEIGVFTTLTTSGERIGRTDLAGRTLVGFFTMGCAPCKRLTPRFVDYADSFPGGHDQVLAVIVAAGHEDPAPQVAALNEAARVVVERPGGPVSAAFGVDAFPFACLLDGHLITAVEAEIGLPVS